MIASPDEPQYFAYGAEATEYLCRRDKRLAAVIRQVGHINRRVIPDLYAALVYSIVGQQISTKAHQTIWQRMLDTLGAVTPERIAALSVAEVQQFGMSLRKAGYIMKATHRITSGEFSLDQLYALDDASVCRRLSSLEGVGEWTAEMLMIFSMQRMDILSYKDYGIVHGMQIVYHHSCMPRERFERYRRRFSPYGSVASLYFWEVAATQR